jgi:hypothetical protein
MKSQTISRVDHSKSISIMVLYMMAGMIILTSTVFSIYSVIRDIRFPVLNHQVHGAVWGVVMVLLGIRYLLSVQKLKVRVYQSKSGFSWSNFKPAHARQPQRMKKK